MWRIFSEGNCVTVTRSPITKQKEYIMMDVMNIQVTKLKTQLNKFLVLFRLESLHEIINKLQN